MPVCALPAGREVLPVEHVEKHAGYQLGGFLTPLHLALESCSASPLAGGSRRGSRLQRFKLRAPATRACNDLAATGELRDMVIGAIMLAFCGALSKLGCYGSMRGYGGPSTLGPERADERSTPASLPQPRM